MLPDVRAASRSSAKGGFVTEIIEAEAVDLDDVKPTVAALAVREHADALVRPAADLAQVERAFNDYQQLCKRILTDDDYQVIVQWNPATKQREPRKFPKRSAWRKLAVAFGVTFEIVTRERERDPAGRVVSADFVVRATAPNGRFADGWGNCDRYERCCQRGCGKRHDHCPPDCDGTRHFTHAEHDIPATAETRAKNRAAADLFGMGQVSAEEVIGDGEPPARAPQPAAPPSEQQSAFQAPAGAVKASQAQVKNIDRLVNKVTKAGTVDAVQLAERFQARYGTSIAAEFTKAQASEIIDGLRKLAGEDDGS